MGKSKYSREEVVEKFRELVETLDLTKEDRRKLSHSYARKNYDWWSSACSQFGNQHSGQDWYGAVENLLVEVISINRKKAEEIVTEIGPRRKVESSGKATRTKPNRKRRKKYTKEEIKEKFNALLITLDLNKNEDMVKLSSTYGRNNYDWWSSTMTHFGETSQDWYSALSNLFINVADKSENEVRELIDRIKKATQTVKAKKGIEVRKKSGQPISPPRYSKEEIKAKFREFVESLDLDDESDLLKLSSTYTRRNIKKFDWRSAALNHFGEKYSWHSTLKALFMEAFGKSESEAEELVKKIDRSGRNSKYTKEEIIVKFRELLEGINLESDADLIKLSLKHAEANYDWFFTSCSFFGRYGGDWYPTLKHLLIEVGKKSENDAELLVTKIIDIGRKETGKIVGARVLKYTKEEVEKNFRELLSTLDLTSKEDLAKLMTTYARYHYDWWASASTHFGAKPRRQDWYTAIKNLFILVGGKPEKEAEKLVKKIKKIGRKTRGMRFKYTKEEIKEKFRDLVKDLDLSKEEDLRKLSLRYAKKNYNWYYSASRQFGAKGKEGSWYLALKTLLIEADDKSEKAAEEVIEQVLEAVKRKAGMKISASRNKSGFTIVDEYVINCKSNGIDYGPLVDILNENGEDTIKTENGIRASKPEMVVLSTKQEKYDPSYAQQYRLKVAKADWDKLAGEYRKNINKISSFVANRAKIIYLLNLYKKYVINWPSKVVSQASGPSVLHMCMRDLNKQLEKAGVEIPTIIDVDSSMEMLRHGKGQGLLQGDMTKMPLRNGSVDMIENVIFRGNKNLVRDTVVEGARVLDVDGVMFLLSLKRPFTERFHETMEKMGFVSVSRPYEYLYPSETLMEQLSEKVGPDFAEKVREKMRNFYVFTAIKVGEAGYEAKPSGLALRKIHSKKDPLVQQIAWLSRQAFSVEKVEHMDAHINVILDLMNELVERKPSDTWEIYNRLARIEKRKLDEKGWTYSKETAEKSRMLSRKIREKLERRNGNNIKKVARC